MLLTKEETITVQPYGIVMRMHYNQDMAELDDRYDCDFKDWQGCVFDHIDKDDKQHYLIVAFSKGTGIRTISHEAYHASNRIFDKIHAKPDLTNDEPQAYLIGWLADVFDKFLTDTNNKT